MAIRITSKDRQNYTNMRARIRRQIKKSADLGIDITDDIEIVKLKDFTDRKAYNEFMSNAKTFTHRYNTQYHYTPTADGSLISVKEFKKYQENIRKANKMRIERKEKLKHIEESYEKTPTILSKYEFGSVSSDDIQPLKVLEDSSQIPSRTLFNKWKKAREKQAEPDYLKNRSEKARDNFLDTLYMLHGDDANELIEKFKLLDVDDFWYMYQNNEAFKQVFYGSKQDERNEDNPELEDTYVPPKLQVLSSAYDNLIRQQNEHNNR